MSQLQMSLRRIDLHGPTRLPGGTDACHAIHIQSGTAAVNGATHGAGDGVLAEGDTIADGRAHILHFVIHAPDTDSVGQVGEIVLEALFDHHEERALIRLDRVSFPAGARAYRHVHPGPGIRYLTEGRLEIASDHDVTVMDKGSAWFEDAFSPVQATAADVPQTSFIRLLVLPVAYEGKPTISLLDPQDETLPKLQTNTRFLDRVVHWPSLLRSASDR